jgi:hypothetical protein
MCVCADENDDAEECVDGFSPNEGETDARDEVRERTVKEMLREAQLQQQSGVS